MDKNEFKLQIDKYIIYFTIPIAILMVICSSIGIWHQKLYSKETIDWLSQCIGQDISNVFFVVPVLLVSGIGASKGCRTFKIIWLGTMITNVYSYIIYCFAVHFNFLFHIYCCILGLSIFSLLCFFTKHISEDFKSWFNEKTPTKAVGSFLLVIAVVFVFLWLSDSLPAVLTGTVPESIVKDNLTTNPVQALDFSFFLPLMIIAAISLIKKKSLGYLLAPMMIIFAIITNIDIISLMIVAMNMGISNNIQLIICFSVITFVALVFLWQMLKNNKDIIICFQKH
ncbi:membrane protein [Clostridium carboxidivorans P7]|uniref:Uncharacterized protein n=1 Tax=Clostridium carboxidivorans P7 TaxID=536227 RepID=C6PNY4_9CLOT|nr:hypothetical protein [Clostridium carboxidivorans]AKN34158.1 membrane protein [Clostridium carboxidivorans P7]EET89062.1 hypothetical protein CcarbDRAFT_0501 [Clostridium carboxidivorans P7]EFG88385.1 membrane protein, putative [Clostridium carboxidivorans P7]